MTSTPDTSPRETPSDPLPSVDGDTRPTRVRWRMFLLLLLVGALSYIDRISLSVGMPLISDEFHLSPQLEGILLSSFFWTYAAFQIPGGWLADKIGPRKVLVGAVTLWSVFQTLTGLAANGWMMLLARLGLGAAEAPQYPVGAKLGALWLPEKDRARGITLSDSSSTLGAAVGALLVGGLISLFGGWREAFIAVGIVTIGAGLILWRFVRDTPAQHPAVNKAELDLIAAAHAEEDARDSKHGVGKVPAWRFLQFRSFWFMGVGFMAANMVFYGLLTFGPLYLYNERALDIKGLTGAMFAIYISGFFGENIAGWIVAKWRNAGGNANVVMRTMLGISGAIATAAILGVALVADKTTAIVLLAVSLFFLRFLGLYWTLPGSLVVRSQSGVLGGMMNLFSNVGGIIIPIVIGFIVGATGSYFVGLLVFVGCSVVYLACSLMIDYSRKLPVREEWAVAR